MLRFIAGEKFMKSLVRLVENGVQKGGREHLRVHDKVLDLISLWATAYSQHADKVFGRFSDTFNLLRVRGIRFPHPPDQIAPLEINLKKGTEMSNEDILAVIAAVESEGSARPSNNRARVDVDAVSATIEMLLESLAALEPGEEFPDFVLELEAQLRTTQSSIHDMIGLEMVTLSLLRNERIWGAGTIC